MSILRRAVLTVALFAAAAPVAATVLDASATGFTVSNSEIVPVTPKQAWRALVHDVDRWWPAEHTWWGVDSKLSINPHAGGCFCEKFGAHEARHLSVVFVDPPNLLRMSGALGPMQGMGLNGVLDFTLEAVKDEGTRITLRYRAGGYTPDDLSKFAPVVDSVQALQLHGLAEFLRAKAKR